MVQHSVKVEVQDEFASALHLVRSIICGDAVACRLVKLTHEFGGYIDKAQRAMAG
jgi:hypothetical protein